MNCYMKKELIFKQRKKTSKLVFLCDRMIVEGREYEI